MQEIIRILQDYKEVIIGVLCVFLSFIAILVKRKPKTIDDFLLIVKEVCVSLPDLINSVEMPGNGFSKKVKVENCSLVLVRKALGRELSKTEREFALKEIDSSIEAILSTPQKKA